MKKLFLSMGVVALLGLGACGSDSKKNDSAADSTQAAAQQAAAEAPAGIPSTDAKVFGDQASYVKIDAEKPATYKFAEDQVLVKVPLILEKTLKYGENTSIGFTLGLTLLDENGDEIMLPEYVKFETGSKSLDTGFYDELRTFMQSEPGATFNMPFHYSGKSFNEVKAAVESAKSYKVTGFSFVHLPEGE